VVSTTVPAPEPMSVLLAAATLAARCAIVAAVR
jgi:hypothetical protein